MTLRNSKLTLTLSAAAVAVALGATPAFAQQQQRDAQGAQQQGAQQRESGSQQSQSEQRSQQSGAQQSQSASSQQRGADAELDRVVQTHAELETFVEALKTAGLAEELTGDTQYTIFAPTNQAFEAMQQNVTELLEPGNREELVALLRAHIVADDLDPQRARELTAAQTLDGDTIELSTDADKLMIGDATVVTPNIEVQGANLRIYSIDEVLEEGGQRSAAASDGRSRG